MHPDIPAHLPLLIGHRGASSEAPENTLASFRLAWAEGANGIEADFRLCGDGQIVCMHDDSTGRTAGVDLRVIDTPLNELRRLDVGSWKGPAWKGEGIPTLEEVLAALPDGTWFFIELKSGPEIIAPLAKILVESKCSPDRIRLLSFSAPLIAELKRYLPEWQACWLSDYHHMVRANIWRPSRDKILNTLARSNADGLASAARAILDHDLVDELRRKSLEVHVWTVDSLTAARRYRALGVDSIMTNRPGRLRRQLLDSTSP